MKKRYRCALIRGTELQPVLSESHGKASICGGNPLPYLLDADVTELFSAYQEHLLPFGMPPQDKLRNELKTLGVILEDSKDGTTWTWEQG